MYKRHCSSKQLSHSMRCSNATATAVTVVMMLLLVVPWVSGDDLNRRPDSQNAQHKLVRTINSTAALWANSALHTPPLAGTQATTTTTNSSSSLQSPAAASAAAVSDASEPPTGSSGSSKRSVAESSRHAVAGSTMQSPALGLTALSAGTTTPLAPSSPLAAAAEDKHHLESKARQSPGASNAAGLPMDSACTPPVYQYAGSQGIPIPALAPDDHQPNFIIILTDDQGWDDIGLHNADWVNTPNLDKFIRSATLFDNFYTSPQCAPSRAMLLTGRDYPKTGTLLVNAGYDSIHKSETTLGEFMSAAGYNTAQFGKWHNGQEMGYEPHNRGFKESWNVPISLAVHKDPIFVHNGRYELTQGYLEDIMMDKLLAYLHTQEQGDKPFFAYYATHSIHAGQMIFKGNLSDLWGSKPSGDGEMPHRPVPPHYKAKYYNNTKYADVADATKDAFAMLEYLDAALGRLFDYLDSSPLGRSTYVMIGGDNGAALLGKAEREGVEVRMPSKMQGAKSLVLEGGVRNFWAVKGPGVEAGVVDSTLLDLTDVLPTVADLTGRDLWFIPHMPWDGHSFKNLLIPQTGVAGDSSTGSSHGTSSANSTSSTTAGSAYRGTSLAMAKQVDRIVFSLSSQCWDYDALPALGPDRRVRKPQTLLSYTSGGQLHSAYSKQATAWLPRTFPNPPGFQPCIAARWREYKWIGLTNKVYRFVNSSHIELPCNEVTGPEAAQVAAKLSAAAKAWWSSITATPHSFTKPMSYLGLGNGTVTNLLPQSAKQRTPGRVHMLANGVGGFNNPGDRICMDVKVMRPGDYSVTFFYLSQQQATFRLSVGTFSAIINGKAQSIKFLLPAQPTKIRGMYAGTLTLPLSGTQATEACLTLLHSRNTNAPIFDILTNIQLIWQPARRAEGLLGRLAATKDAHNHRHKRVGSKAAVGREMGDVEPLLKDGSIHNRQHWQQDGIHVAVPLGGALSSSKQQWVRELAVSLKITEKDHWTAVRKQYGWPDGQVTLENLFSPYDIEIMQDEADGCDTCAPSI